MLNLNFFTANSQYLLLGLLAIALVSDVIARRAPNILVVFGMLVALWISVLDGSNVNLIHSLLGAGLALLIFYYPFSRAYLGAGDVKLFAMVGMFLGPGLGFWAFLFSCLVGGIIAIAYGLLKGRLGGIASRLNGQGACQMDLPYAIAIFIGTAMAIFNFQRILLDA